MRRCATCRGAMAHRAAQAKHCSDACKQEAYRDRLDPDEQPTQLWATPAETPDGAGGYQLGDWRLARDPDGGWVLDHPSGERHAVGPRSLTDGQARARARWRLAQLVATIAPARPDRAS